MSASLLERETPASLVTAKGQSIRFKESDIREMGRGAAGVKAMKLDKGDHVVAALVVPKLEKKYSLLIISSNGYGKRTEIENTKFRNEVVLVSRPQT